MPKYLVGTKSYSEYGHLHGVYDIILVDTMEEAILEQQKRMIVRVYKRNRPKDQFRQYSPRFIEKYNPKPVDEWARYDKYYPGDGVEISVQNETGIYEIIDNKIEITPEEDSQTGTEYGGFVICTPVYEQDPRGSAYNHKIIKYEFAHPDPDPDLI